ncbi:sensor histidine kinase [Fretibacter rubidus]|uniref:sensor histidine kinase n=1 Tax=Fretibacter rubidus TaxID=570162 RepID=UPI00352A637D
MDVKRQDETIVFELDCRFTDVVDHWSLPVMILDRQLRFVFANDAYLTSTKSDWDMVKGQHVFEVFPDSPERVAQVHDYFRRGFDGEKTRMDEQPFILTDDNGHEVTHYWQAVQEPMRNKNGDITHVIQYCEDVTARVHAQREQAIIAGELEHRVKNVMSVIQSVARITSRNHDSVEDFTHDFISRINAMSRNHSRLYRNDFQGATLREIFAEELDAMSIDASHGYDLNGDDVNFNTALSKDFSMVVHELVTNAVKYGCFSCPGGTLLVTWERDSDGVKIKWEESGVGPIGNIDRDGFGTKLIRMLRNIDCERIATPDGLHVHMTVTL